MNPVLNKLEKILNQVENPARYIGGEANGVQKDITKMKGSMALVFPDTYEVGMSNNGTRVLYHLVNREEDLLAESAFAPWLDMADLMRKSGLELYTHESYRPVKDFDVIGMTLQTELNYTNVPYLLKLIGIPVWAAERTKEHPFLVGGGPCMANPEPVADFYDLFVIGDGEVLAAEITRRIGAGRRAGKSREEILLGLADLQGVYIPSLMEVETNAFGEQVATRIAKGSYQRTEGIKRTWVEVLDKENYPTQNLIPNTKLVHNRFAIEVMRGCTQGCRFCQAGYWYRPNRELHPDAVVEIAKKGVEATGEKELSLLSLSTADYSQVENVTDMIIDDEDFHHVDVSLPSLRANSFGQTLARKVAAVKGGRSATFAPETGSERLRKMINKTISDEDMYKAAHNVFSAGFTKIKLYTMVGLPTENLEDMEAFCGLIENLMQIGKKYGSNRQVHASVGVMVPKPFTPMQWVGFMEREKVESHIRFVRERFRWNRQVKITWTDWKEAHLESFYSRGDRNLSQIIYEASEKGLVFESYGEQQNYEAWQELWEKYDYPQERIFGERSFDENFVWDFIHAGTSKGYLKNEYKKMFLPSEPVPDCKWGVEDCQKCGIPGNYADTQLAPEPEVKAPNRSPEEVKELFSSRNQKERSVFKYRITFFKTGLSRFLPHQNLQSLLERAFNRMHFDLNYSQGFSPRPKISNQGALPLGLSSRAEAVGMEFLSELPLENKEALLENLNKIFPQGIGITDIERYTSKKMPRSISSIYSYEGEWEEGSVMTRWKSKSFAPVENHRGQVIPVMPGLLDVWKGENGALFVKATTNQSGNTISPFLIYASMLELPLEEVRLLHIYKEENEYIDPCV